MKYFLIAIFTITSFQGLWAHDLKKCFSFQTKAATFRKYDLKYMAPSSHPSDFKNCSIPTDTTSKEGISAYSSNSSTQGSTASVDPGVTTKSSTGNTQFSSSFGECSMLGKVEDIQRDTFVASNWESLRQDISLGQGDLLATLASLSKCSADVYTRYVREARVAFANANSAEDFSRAIPLFIANDEVLQNSCI